MGNKFDYTQQKVDKIPIRKGCSNKQCFCTGKCQEIIAWRDPLPQENVLKCVK